MTDPARATPPRAFETPRLRLRPPRTSDASEIFRRYASDATVTRYLSWPPHREESETFAFLCLCLDDWAEARSFAYVVETKNDPGRAAGMVQITPRAHEGVLGYVLAEELRGQGVVVEALEPLLDWALTGPSGLWRVSAFCDVDNPASARVMEKAGLTFEGRLKRYSVFPNVSAEPRDCLLYAAARMPL